MNPPRIAVIGAGVGGLSAATRLARRGARVVLFERNARVGGKLNWLERDGYSWDMGPSLLTMPEVFREWFAELGENLDEHLELVPLRSTCRYHWTDGTRIDEDAAFWQRPEVARFLNYARGLYEISAEAFLYHPLEEWWRQLKPSFLPKLRHLPKIASLQTLAEKVAGFFPHDSHLRQLFDRFATYNGSSPFITPSAFNIIPYVQARFGGWYVRGGLYEIARAALGVAQKLGVEIRPGTEVTAARPGARSEPAGAASTGWELQTAAGWERFDRVVCNQDVLAALPRFLPAELGERFRRTHLARQPLSTSGFVLYLGVAREHPQLEHHNIFFSDDYPREFREMFEDRAPAAEPTIYVCIHSKSDPARAPAGCENWFVLVNAPAVDEARPLDWPALAQTYGDAILDRLEQRFGLTGLRSAIRVREHFTPADFITRYGALGGALYGFASHSTTSAFRRPPLQAKGVENFYFVGGSTHPGGGLPLVVLSGKMVAEKIARSWG